MPKLQIPDSQFISVKYFTNLFDYDTTTVRWCYSVLTGIKFLNTMTPSHHNPYSERSDWIGFASEALIAWKLTVNKAISKAVTPASANNHQLRSMR